MRPRSACYFYVMPPKRSPLPLPDFEDEATLYSLSSEFFEAAMVLYKTLPVRIRYDLVAYYLAGHAAELILKCFLYKCGDAIDVLAKRYRHDLKLLIRRARSKGLPVSVSTDHIELLSGAYTRKRTEYRQKRQLQLPQLDLLLGEISTLHLHVFEQIAEFRNISHLGELENASTS